MKTDRELLLEQAGALMEDVPYLVTNLANISALVFESFSDLNWAGFYILKNDELILGPFQGKRGCRTKCGDLFLNRMKSGQTDGFLL